MIWVRVTAQSMFISTCALLQRRIKLLCINHPALQKELTEAHQHGVGYTLVQAGTFLGYEDLQLPLGKNDLVLAPVIAGSGGGTGTDPCRCWSCCSINYFCSCWCWIFSRWIGVGSSTTGSVLRLLSILASTTSVLNRSFCCAWCYRYKFVLGGTHNCFHRSRRFLLSTTEPHQGKTQTLQAHKVFPAPHQGNSHTLLLVLQIPLVLERQCLLFTASC